MHKSETYAAKAPLKNWQGRKAPLPIRSDRDTPTPLCPINIALNTSTKKRWKEKESRRERERGGGGGFEGEINRRAGSTRRETTWHRKKRKKNETLEERGRAVTSLFVVWNSNALLGVAVREPRHRHWPPPQHYQRSSQTSKATPPSRQVTLLSPPLLLHFQYKLLLHAEQNICSACRRMGGGK